jgi:hypothetical protein
MSWTYDPAQIASSPLMQLRWLIGDTLTKDQQLQDEELTWAMTQRTSIYGAAADACRSLAGRMAREADSTQGSLHTLYSAKSRNYRAMSGTFEVQAMARSGGLPYSGQTSKTDYQAMLADPDRMGPQFNIGLEDNYLPAGIVAPENQGGGGPD